MAYKRRNVREKRGGAALLMAWLMLLCALAPTALARVAVDALDGGAIPPAASLGALQERDAVSETEDTRLGFYGGADIAGSLFSFTVSPLDHEVIDPPLYAASFSRAPLPPSAAAMRVALTFDDGPSVYTKRILDTLERYGAKATFCVLGSRVNNYASTIERANRMGCEIIGHSWSHKSLTSLPLAEIENDISRTASVIKRVTGTAPKLFRPPYGSVNNDVRLAARRQGAAIIMWSVDTLDWSSRNADRVYNAIMSEVKNGSIILCHDMYATTADAVSLAVPELIRRGYQLVTVSELLRFDENGVTAGMTYRNK
ncbi:MAG: polysaccharide deacetylase family protein [Oscillospiraceae bacterium]|jgi:peptidoglycan/xylan/chitin deacetylase (PgdA/CDA1 family)|nr:polysaccharide deacetylase family protein [Oscillospiraceae bacterium]